MQAWWQRDQIISAFIIGSFSMSATLISMYVNGRRAAATKTKGKRARRKAPGRRRYAILFLAGLVAGGMGYRFGATTLGAEGMSVLGPAGASESPQPVPLREEPGPVSTVATDSAAYRDDPGEAWTMAEDTAAFDAWWAGFVADTRDAGPAKSDRSIEAEGVAEPVGPSDTTGEEEGDVGREEEVSRSGALHDPTAPDEPLPAPSGLADWLHAEGMRIHYRYAERLPDACEGKTTALGNWVDGEQGMPVECIDDEWLVLDVTELVESGRLTRNATHCFALRSEAGHWAQHDRAPSPGLERVAIASKSDHWGSPPIGFRVLRTDGPDRIEFVNGYPRVYC